MKTIDIIIIAIVVVILGLVIRYIYKAKKQGVKCIGCPNGSKCSGSCGGKCGEGCSCGCNTEQK